VPSAQAGWLHLWFSTPKPEVFAVLDAIGEQDKRLDRWRLGHEWTDHRLRQARRTSGFRPDDACIS
jgi:hypothetical protein